MIGRLQPGAILGASSGTPARRSPVVVVSKILLFPGVSHTTFVLVSVDCRARGEQATNACMGIAFNKWKVGNFDHGILDSLVHPWDALTASQNAVPIIVRPAACRLFEHCVADPVRSCVRRSVGRSLVRGFAVEST